MLWIHNFNCLSSCTCHTLYGYISVHSSQYLTSRPELCCWSPQRLGLVLHLLLWHCSPFSNWHNALKHHRKFEFYRDIQKEQKVNVIPWEEEQRRQPFICHIVYESDLSHRCMCLLSAKSLIHINSSLDHSNLCLHICSDIDLCIGSFTQASMQTKPPFPVCSHRKWRNNSQTNNMIQTQTAWIKHKQAEPNTNRLNQNV